MKKIIPFFLWILSVSVIAQIPSYYNGMNLNQTGTNLKNELASKVISTHTTYLSYTPGVWNALQQADLDPNNSSKVVLLYGWNDTDGNITNDRTRNKNANGGSTGQWNREHVYAKSLGNPNLGTSGAGADAHHLRPCDIQRNSSRNNRKFANGNGNSGITSTGNWYPGDEWKGDVARMMMYMYIRYGNQCLPKGVATGSTATTDSNMVNLFLAWNAEDPVSELEIQRNNVLAGIQGNRNPFIDNPAFATQIWGGPQAEDKFGNGSGSSDTQAPTTPFGLSASNITENSVNLSWSSSSDNVGVTGYSIFRSSVKIGSTTSTNFSVSGLTAGTSYTFTVQAYDAAGNSSNNSNTVSVTTTTGDTGGGNGTATELLISEYVEGSSYNKAIEIANFTGSSVNLSNYALKKVTNGGGSWSSTTTLNGTLANGEVYVIAHNKASSTITNKADKTTSSGIINFNGNDAIGLFKNGVLIDKIGNPNSSANFAKDKTLRRKALVSSPNTSYVTTEWTILANNTSSGLGAHTISGSGNTSPVPVSYCTSKGNNTSDEYIDNVSIGGISNSTTANNGYGDFTSQTGVLPYGQNTIVVSAGFSGNSFTEFWKVWIDFNQNGIFENTEEVVNDSSSSDANLSYAFSVPTSAKSGKTRMRVSMKWNSAQTACENFSYGEVEDYSVIIGTSSRNSSLYNKKAMIDKKRKNQALILNTRVYPNPVTDFITIQLADNKNSRYNIINQYGKIVMSGTIDATIDVRQLTTGCYIIQISNGENIFTKRIIKK